MVYSFRAVSFLMREGCRVFFSCNTASGPWTKLEARLSGAVLSRFYQNIWVLPLGRLPEVGQSAKSRLLGTGAKSDVSDRGTTEWLHKEPVRQIFLTSESCKVKPESKHRAENENRSRLMLRGCSGYRPSANDDTIQLPSSETEQHQQIEDKFKGQRTLIG